jgi:hypothetical protein
VSRAESVLEHHESAPSRWLRERRLRIALLVAFVESVLVLLNDHGWWFVVGAAAVAFALYWLARRRTEQHLLHEATWILAVSQLIAVLVPVLWVLVKTIAIVVLVVLGLFLLAALLLERPGR